MNNAKKAADVIRRLLSDHDGEIVAAVHALKRLFDIHLLAKQVEGINSGKANGELTEDDQKKIAAKIEEAYANGYADGVRTAENKQHSTGSFRNTDGTPDWREVALYVQREKHQMRRLSDWENEFIDDMASRTVRPNYEPSVKQHRQLHRLFLQLGGKIT
jgi:hypothetical protein